MNINSIIVSEDHIDPLRDENYLIYKLGYIHPVVGGKREVSMLWGNVKSKPAGASAVHGLGMDFVTGSPVDMGLPTLIDSYSENSLTEHSHTHKLGNVNINDVVSVPPVEYGALYNWYAVDDARKITSSNDWIVPSSSDYEALLEYIDNIESSESSESIYLLAGGYLKEEGIEHWETPNIGATDDYGFKATGGGIREEGSAEIAEFSQLNQLAWFLCSDEYYLSLEYDSSIATINSLVDSLVDYLYVGMSVRLCNPNTLLLDGEVGEYLGNDGKVYLTIVIDGVEYLSENLNETKYRNGEWIAGFNAGVYTPISDEDWFDLITGAMCYYGDVEDAGGIAIPFVPQTEPQVQSDWNQASNAVADYIKNKPTIPDTQVQSDWDAVAGMGVILNKPSIPAAQIQSDWNQASNAVADYIKNKPSIPAAQIQSDWNAVAGMGVILNKPSIPDPQVGDNTYLGLEDTSDTTYTAKDIYVPVVDESESKLTLTETVELTLAMLQALGVVSDIAYNATSWDNVTTIAPSKNAVRDKFESVQSGMNSIPKLTYFI